MTRPAPGAKELRLFVLPVARCERCGDDMIPDLGSPVCVPCKRRAAIRQRLGQRAQERRTIERLLRSWAAA